MRKLKKSSLNQALQYDFPNLVYAILDLVVVQARNLSLILDSPVSLRTLTQQLPFSMFSGSGSVSSLTVPSLVQAL